MRSEAAGAPLSAGVLGTTTDGLVEPAGVLHARTAPPREAARARASRIRFVMILGFLRFRGVGGSDTSRGLGMTTATDVSEDRGTATRRSAPGPLQAPRIPVFAGVRAGSGRPGRRGSRPGEGRPSQNRPSRPLPARATTVIGRRSRSTCACDRSPAMLRLPMRERPSGPVRPASTKTPTDH